MLSPSASVSLVHVERHVFKDLPNFARSSQLEMDFLDFDRLPQTQNYHTLQDLTRSFGFRSSEHNNVILDSKMSCVSPDSSDSLEGEDAPNLKQRSCRAEVAAAKIPEEPHLKAFEVVPLKFSLYFSHVKRS